MKAPKESKSRDWRDLSEDLQKKVLCHLTLSEISRVALVSTSFFSLSKKILKEKKSISSSESITKAELKPTEPVPVPAAEGEHLLASVDINGTHSPAIYQALVGPFAEQQESQLQQLADNPPEDDINGEVAVPEESVPGALSFSLCRFS